jgi:KipI family sensor histidine kinase inhibitor
VCADLTLIRTADDTFEISVETSQQAQTLAARLRQSRITEDVVAGLETVAIHFEPSQARAIEALVHEQKTPSAEPSNTIETIEIGIEYGGESGPDFTSVCDALNLSPEGFIALHCDRVHMVEMIGFTPGFAYLSGLPEAFKIPRLANPRPRLPAGSVGMSANYTGIYALDGPGGWPLIGRTSAKLFELNTDPPFLLQPGQRVQFRSV